MMLIMLNIFSARLCKPRAYINTFKDLLTLNYFKNYITFYHKPKAVNKIQKRVTFRVYFHE